MNHGYLKQARKSLGMTQNEFAIALGISTSHYSKIEGGFELPSTRLLIRIKAVMGKKLNLNRLLGKETATP